MTGLNSGTESLSEQDVETGALSGLDRGTGTLSGLNSGKGALSGLDIETRALSGLDLVTGVTKGSDEGGRRGGRLAYKSISWHTSPPFNTGPRNHGANTL